MAAPMLTHGGYPVVLSDALLGRSGGTEKFTGVRYTPTSNPPPAPSTISSAALKPSTSDRNKFNLTLSTPASTSYYQGTRNDGYGNKPSAKNRKAESKYVLIFDAPKQRFVLHALDSEFDMAFVRADATSPKPSSTPSQLASQPNKVGGKTVPKSTSQTASPPPRTAQKGPPKKRREPTPEDDDDSDGGLVIEYPSANAPPLKKRTLGLGLLNSPLSMAHLSAGSGRVAGKSPMGYAGKSPAGYAGKSPAGVAGKSPVKTLPGARVAGKSPYAGKSPAGFAGKSPAGYATKRSPPGFAGKSPVGYASKGSPPGSYIPQSPKFEKDSDAESDEDEEMEDVDITQNTAHDGSDDEEEQDVDGNPYDLGSPRGAGNARHDGSDSEDDEEENDEDDLEALMEKEMEKALSKPDVHVRDEGAESSESEEE